MRIIKKPYALWDGATKKLMRRATLPRGAMWKIVKALPDIPAYAAFEENSFLGWAIAWKLPEEMLVQLYVKKRHRKRGVATCLIACIMRGSPWITLCRWTHETNMFFHRLRLAHPKKIRVITWGRHEDAYLARLPKRRRANTE